MLCLCVSVSLFRRLTQQAELREKLGFLEESLGAANALAAERAERADALEESCQSLRRELGVRDTAVVAAQAEVCSLSAFGVPGGLVGGGARINCFGAMNIRFL